MYNWPLRLTSPEGLNRGPVSFRVDSDMGNVLAVGKDFFGDLEPSLLGLGRMILHVNITDYIILRAIQIQPPTLDGQHAGLVDEPGIAVGCGLVPERPQDGVVDADDQVNERRGPQRYGRSHGVVRAGPREVGRARVKDGYVPGDAPAGGAETDDFRQGVDAAVGEDVDEECPILLLPPGSSSISATLVGVIEVRVGQQQVEHSLEVCLGTLRIEEVAQRGFEHHDARGGEQAAVLGNVLGEMGVLSSEPAKNENEAWVVAGLAGLATACCGRVRGWMVDGGVGGDGLHERQRRLRRGRLPV